jgi:hypothetical protein
MYVSPVFCDDPLSADVFSEGEQVPWVPALRTRVG